MDNGKFDIDKIMDGYTLQGYIAAIPGVHGDLSFIYRPVDPITRRKFQMKKNAVIHNKGLTDLDKEIACEVVSFEMVLGNVFAWNLTDDAGEKVEKSVTSLLRYFPDYRLNRLMEIVGAGFASDQRPEKPTEEQPQDETGDLEQAEGNSAAA